MPHIIVEYSDNIQNQLDVSAFMQKMHQCVINHDIAAHKIKTRAIQLNDYIIGDAKPDDSMIHTTLLLLEGRGQDFAKTLGQAAYDTAKEYTIQNIPSCGVSLELREMKSETYFK